MQSQDTSRLADNQAVVALLLATRRLLNLSSHPYFPPVTELPAWQEAIAEASNAVLAVERIK